MGSRKVTRSQLKRGARSQREQLESYQVLKKVIDQAKSHGHYLGEVVSEVGPRGGTSWKVDCSCGAAITGRRSAWAAYNEGMGHLAEILGQKSRDKAARALQKTRLAG